MKLTFLGTGAADWCLAIRDGKKVTRRYSSVIIDDELVIDPGPGVLDALKVNKIEFASVKYVLNTHDHDDHAAHKKTDQDGNQRCQHLFGAVLAIDIQQRIFHTASPPSV